MAATEYDYGHSGESAGEYMTKLFGKHREEPSAEEQIRKSIRQTSAGSFLAMDPVMSKKLVNAVKEQVGDITHQERPPVLISSMDVRRYMKKLIELDIPQLTVLSHQELTEEINIQPLGRISIH
jgi:type III secretion protein V